MAKVVKRSQLMKAIITKWGMWTTFTMNFRRWERLLRSQCAEMTAAKTEIGK